MPRETIARHMTPSPHTVGVDQPLRAAHALMAKHQVRHLPVLEAGRLVGLVSLRDLHFLESLGNVDPDVVTIEDAMTVEPYAVAPTTSLEEVVSTMAAQKYGSAVIVDDEGRVAGVFTTVDALEVLARMLAGRPHRRATGAGARATSARAAHDRPGRGR